MDRYLLWITALSSLGCLVLGIAKAFLARSSSRTEIRWELTHQDADVPYLLNPMNFERSIREGLAYFLPGSDDTYDHAIRIQCVVRVSRQGRTPLTVEYVELGDTKGKHSLARQPGQIGSAVRTIDPNSHAEWRFNFVSVAKQLSYHYRAGDYPNVDIRVALGGRPKRAFAKKSNIDGNLVHDFIDACRNVWADFPNQLS